MISTIVIRDILEMETVHAYNIDYSLRLEEILFNQMNQLTK